MYRIYESSVIAWQKYNNLEFIQCACRLTEKAELTSDGTSISKRQEVKELIKRLKKTNPNIEKSIFNSIHSVCLDTFPRYKSDGEEHSFLEKF